VQESIGYGVVVNNGYDITKFRPSDDYKEFFRKKINIITDHFMIGHVGRFDSNKDYLNLLDPVFL